MFRTIGTNILCAAVLMVFAGSFAGAEQQAPAASREHHERTAEKKLQELGRNMDELAAEAGKKEEQLRAEVNRYYDEFKKKQKAASRELDELRKSTNETWDKTKVKMDKALDDLNRLYEQAKGSVTKKDKDTAK